MVKNTHKHTVSEHITTLSLQPFAQINIIMFCVTLFKVLVIHKVKANKNSEQTENISKSKIIILILF